MISPNLAFNLSNSPHGNMTDLIDPPAAASHFIEFVDLSLLIPSREPDFARTGIAPTTIVESEGLASQRARRARTSITSERGFPRWSPVLSVARSTK
jgi:hypothetical protein